MPYYYLYPNDSKNSFRETSFPVLYQLMGFGNLLLLSSSFYLLLSTLFRILF